MITCSDDHLILFAVSFPFLPRLCFYHLTTQSEAPNAWSSVACHPPARGCCRDGKKSIASCVSPKSYSVLSPTALEWLKQGSGYEENREGCLGFVLFAVEKRSSKVLIQGIGGVENELTLVYLLMFCCLSGGVERVDRRIISKEFKRSPAIDQFEANQRPLAQGGDRNSLLFLLSRLDLKVILLQSWE